MEKAVFISNLRRLPDSTSGYERLYFGNEFCERLLPSVAILESAVEEAAGRGLAFTLVTSFATDAGLDRMKPLFEALHRMDIPAEIVVNDWGVLGYLKRTFADNCLPLAAGRLLTKQARDPRLGKLAETVPDRAMAHFRMSNVDGPRLAAFLRRMGVVRAEFDNPLHGLERQDPDLPGSIYHPYLYLTTTRLCYATARKGGQRGQRTPGLCAMECRDRTFSLTHRKMPADLLLHGNTIFLENRQLPVNLEQLRVDRLVYQPDVPM